MTRWQDAFDRAFRRDTCDTLRHLLPDFGKPGSQADLQPRQQQRTGDDGERPGNHSTSVLQRAEANTDE